MPVDWSTGGTGGVAAAGPQALLPSNGGSVAFVQADESLWRDYRTQLVRFVLKRVADEATAEDIVHDVLVRAYERRDTLRDGQKFEPWLYQITRNAVVDHYRRRRPSEPLPADLIAETPAADAQRELAKCMKPLIDALPGHYRDALTLSEIQGLTQQDTAGRLGLTLSGAKSRVQRGRRMLEEKLLQCCRVEFDTRGAIIDFESRKGCAPGSGDGCAAC
jgi:RNA polymerase sigma-70 factor, ECF subfamily